MDLDVDRPAVSTVPEKVTRVTTPVDSVLTAVNQGIPGTTALKVKNTWLLSFSKAFLSTYHTKRLHYTTFRDISEVLEKNADPSIRDIYYFLRWEDRKKERWL